MNQPKLVFISGLMKGGKSAKLIDMIEEEDQPFIILKPAIDTRDGAYVKTRKHDRKYPAVPVDENNVQLVELVLFGIQKYYTVFIDEVHFFSEEFIRKVADYCYTYGADLVVSGLLRDFKGDMFPSSKFLFHNNDEMEFLTGDCDLCKKEAVADIRMTPITHRIILHGDAVEVEGEATYATVCKDCHARKLLEVM